MKPSHRHIVALVAILTLSACALPPQYPYKHWSVDDLPRPYNAYQSL